jgi:hypothetical protein
VWTAVWRAEIASCTANCLYISPTFFTCILWCPDLHRTFLCFFVFTWFTLLPICSTKLIAMKCAFYIFTLSFDEWDLLLMLSLIEHFLCGMMIPMALGKQLDQSCFTKDHICICTTWTGKRVKNVRKDATVS